MSSTIRSSSMPSRPYDKAEDDPIFRSDVPRVESQPGSDRMRSGQSSRGVRAGERHDHTGSQHLRLNSTFRTALANGDYATLANLINVFNGTGAGGAIRPPRRHRQFRRCPASAARFSSAPTWDSTCPEETAGSNIPSSVVVPAGLFPANWITANPQVSTANYYNNNGNPTTTPLQMQTTIRAAQGLTFQGTYVWSRALALSSTVYTNPADRRQGLQSGADPRHA